MEIYEGWPEFSLFETALHSCTYCGGSAPRAMLESADSPSLLKARTR